jgi:hypothetical protein
MGARYGNKLHVGTPHLPLSQRDQQRISVATIIAYSRFRRECLAYHHTLANYLMLMHWIDERRIEMQAEGRRHWVPSVYDLESPPLSLGRTLSLSSFLSLNRLVPTKYRRNH